MKRGDPEYQKQQTEKERQDLINTLKASNDPAAKIALQAIENPSPESFQPSEITSHETRNPYPTNFPRNVRDPNALIGKQEKTMSEAHRAEVLQTIQDYKKDVTKKPRDLLIKINEISQKHNYYGV